MVVKIINHLINRQLQQHYCYKLELLCQEEGNYVFSLPKLCKHSTPRASSTKFCFRYRNIYSIYLLTLYSVAYGIGIMNRICQNIPSNLHLICCRLFILDPLTLSFGQEMIILVSKFLAKNFLFSFSETFLFTHSWSRWKIFTKVITMLYQCTILY